MLRSEFMIKAKELTITQADNDLFYLEPSWRAILCDNKLSVYDISDYTLTLEEVSEELRLEVEKRNIIKDNKTYVINWLYDLITTQVEPAILAEETDYIKQVTEFMRQNHLENKEQ